MFFMNPVLRRSDRRHSDSVAFFPLKAVTWPCSAQTAEPTLVDYAANGSKEPNIVLVLTLF